VGASASELCYAVVMRRADPACPKGLRQFLDPEQQQAWLEGEIIPLDADERAESLEQRFKYAARFEKLLRRPRAQDVLDILQIYAATCLPIPRATERFYWSVSCLPSTSDKPLARVNASWMELFTLLPDSPSPVAGEGALRSKAGEGCVATDIRARFILHLADFTSDGSAESDQVDTDLLEKLVERPEDVSHAVWRNGKEILIAKVRGAASIRRFIAHPQALRAIRNFNLTHMNRGRNAYQASHCYSLADVMLSD
jgi:hypothetical protein